MTQEWPGRVYDYRTTQKLKQKPCLLQNCTELVKQLTYDSHSLYDKIPVKLNSSNQYSIGHGLGALSRPWQGRVTIYCPEPPSPSNHPPGNNRVFGCLSKEGRVARPKVLHINNL